MKHLSLTLCSCLEGHHQQLFFLVQSAWHSWLTLGLASSGCRESSCGGPAGSQVKGHEHSEGKIKVICSLSWSLQGWLEADTSPEIDPVSLGSAPSLASA